MNMHFSESLIVVDDAICRRVAKTQSFLWSENSIFLFDNKKTTVKKHIDDWGRVTVRSRNANFSHTAFCTVCEMWKQIHGARLHLTPSYVGMFVRQFFSFWVCWTWKREKLGEHRVRQAGSRHHACTRPTTRAWNVQLTLPYMVYMCCVRTQFRAKEKKNISPWIIRFNFHRNGYSH